MPLGGDSDSDFEGNFNSCMHTECHCGQLFT